MLYDQVVRFPHKIVQVLEKYIKDLKEDTEEYKNIKSI